MSFQPNYRYMLEVLHNRQPARQQTNGYALGSGNSIPDYVPVEGYLAMVRAAQHIRANGG